MTALRRALVALSLAGLLMSGCVFPGRVEQFSGNVWGTTYHIRYVPAGSVVPQDAIDDLLSSINQSLSTYIDTSVISRINASTDITAWHPVDAHFATVFRRARTFYEDTGGAFNPAVGPLVNAWGFGPEGPGALPDEATIRQLLEVTSFDAFEFRDSPPAVRKRVEGARLDFNAVAEGYAVDQIGELFERRGVRNYVVELSGEVRARGRHPDGTGWRIGIEKPSAGATNRQMQTTITLQDAGLSTSGNYRKRRVQDGKLVAHIVNPRTGYPALNSLLSASVMADDAMTANAYSTAFIVLGMEDALRFVEARPNLHAYFIAQDPAGNIVEKRSKGFPDSLEN